MNVVVLIPSRGRPERALEAIEALRATAALVSTSILLVVDADDPRRPDYDRCLRPTLEYRPEVSILTLGDGQTGDLVKATNTAAMVVARADPSSIIGVLNDDMLARTPGWDRRFVEVLAEPGIAYGDDLFQGEQLVTSPFMSAVIPLALGWYALPDCEHLFIDNAWRDLGRAIGRLHYLPELVFEHIHPLAGKAAWDEGYERANNQAVTDHDRIAYEAWRGSGGLDRDALAIRQELEAAA